MKYSEDRAKFDMEAFVDELYELINKSILCFQLERENEELRERIKRLEEDTQTLVNTKATEYVREVETEVMVRLAIRLAPIFGITMPENYERRVREFLNDKKNN